MNRKWIVDSSGMALFIYATLLKNAILELKKHDQDPMSDLCMINILTMM